MPRPASIPPVASHRNGSGDEDHFQRLLRLLEWESQAEARRARETAQKLAPQDAEKSGNCLVGLVLVDEYAGLGGRTLVTFAKRDQNATLPWNRLDVGTPVIVLEEHAAGGDGWRGVVSQRGERQIQVAMDRSPESDAERPTFRLDLSYDEIARQRQRIALERARVARGDRLAELRSVLLGERPAVFVPADADLADTLNESQREAIRFALSAEDLAIIHGPPGTGKTTTVVALIREAIARGEKVLACAPSNIGVDNVFERLLTCGVNAVRLGHPARVLPELRAHTLDMLVDAHPDLRLARRLFKEANALRDKAARYTRAKPLPGARREMRAEASQLRDDARRIEAQVVEEVLNSAAVICSTLTGIDSELLGRREFDLAVIDEACQSTEPACWLPLLRCRRIVLAGDHLQLPPTIISADAARDGFGVSLLERLMNAAGSRLSRRLTTQYRMHRTIMDFSSRRFYESSLVADASVAEHRLCDLEHVAASDWTATPLHFIDTAGAWYDEEQEPDGESRLNRQEAEVVFGQVHGLFAAGLRPADIAVIAPYSAQVRHLRERLPVPGLEIDSVDGFQGREKEAIVISLVRSNPAGEIGFLSDTRRMNVALTRARRKLIVIGDSATIGGHEFYRELLSYFDAVGAYRSVWEFL